MKIKKLSGKVISNGRSIDYKLRGYNITSNVELDMCILVGIYIKTEHYLNNNFRGVEIE